MVTNASWNDDYEIIKQTPKCLPGFRNSTHWNIQQLISTRAIKFHDDDEYNTYEIETVVRWIDRLQDIH